MGEGLSFGAFGKQFPLPGSLLSLRVSLPVKPEVQNQSNELQRPLRLYAVGGIRRRVSAGFFVLS